MTIATHGSASGEKGNDATGSSIIPCLNGRRKSLVAILSLALAVGCGAKSSPIDGKSAAELEAMLRSSDPTAQAQGALGLSRLGPEASSAVPALIDALKSSQALVRQNAALALGKVGPEAKAAVPALTEALKDSEWGVQRMAALSLGQIGAAAKSAAPALQKLAKDKNRPVREAATDALKKVGSG